MLWTQGGDRVFLHRRPAESTSRAGMQGLGWRPGGMDECWGALGVGQRVQVWSSACRVWPK
jgi:hypothetical protein